MKAMIGVAAVVGVLMVPAAASATTTKCRIEKPARPSYGPAKLSDLTAANLPQHRTWGGSPCATASELASQFERLVAHHKEVPEIFETSEDQRTGAPRLEWRNSAKTDGLEGKGGHIVARLTETFVHGAQRVSLQARVQL